MIEKPNMTAWERLSNPLNTFRGSKYCFSARHMPYLLKKLRSMYGAGPYAGGPFAFGHAIDVSNAELIKTHIQRNYQDWQVNAAHEACVRDYQTHNPRTNSKPRMNMQTDKIEDSPDVENALFEDDTLKVEGVLFEDDTPKQDNIQIKLPEGDYIMRPEFAAQITDIRHNIKNNAGFAATFKREQEEFNNDVAARVLSNTERIIAIEQSKPTIIELKTPGLPEITNLGLQHKNFPLLLATVQSRLRNGNRVIPWVYGPAGTGKSFAAESLAKALNLKPYVMGTTLTKFEVTGFINTTGYQTTAFREAYEHGGAFCADEMDSWTKEATVALNNGLANSHFTFPDKTVARHPDFVMVACANTVGTGANLDYVGRNKLDGATLNRFAYIHWPLDEALEDGICANKDWLQYVRRVRRNVANSNLNPKPLITPRASIFGETLLNSGIEWATVVEMCLRQGLSDAQWNGIK